MEVSGSVKKKHMSTLKESKSKKLLKFDDFTGFDVSDDLKLTNIIEIKSSCIKTKISQPGLSTDENTPSISLSILNDNHLKKKYQLKSSSSSFEDSDEKNNCPPSVKKLKKDNPQGELMDSLESNVQHSLEFTTPTFNLTSIPKIRRSTGRKVNTDISDPIYKLPFKHGWKRELVYRTSGDSSTINKTNRSGDVYYYSPNNKKLRSLREIQEQLDLSLSDDMITIESFTFLKQPIGMNDKSKELIRDANTKLSKDDTFVGISVKPKKPKTPIPQPVIDFELSDDNENTKTSNKMKFVFKNLKDSKKKSKSKSRKDNKNDLEPINTSVTTPEYNMSEEMKVSQSSSISTITPPKSNDTEVNSTNVKQRLSTSDGEVIMQTPCGIRCPNSDEPATLMCAQCLVYYHPACVNLNANLKIVGYVCINCRSSVKQRNRRHQSSHTVVVGVSEPEQLRVEPIRIRQVHQTSDSPNFFIDRTSISKSEEQNNEIDEHIDENDSVIKTVTCQGNVYKTAMLDGSFCEQYVYEMKQTRGPSLMTCVVQEPKSLDETSEMNGLPTAIGNTYANMQTFNYMANSMRHVFTYLKMKELLCVSRVCTSWNMLAMSKLLWQNVRLKNATICDWDKFVDTINRQGSISLDSRRMLIPSKTQDFENFWSKFSSAIKRATRLEVIELYRCPINVVHDVMCSLPQLVVLNATSIKNPHVTKDAKIVNEYMSINLDCVSKMVNLTELRLKGLTGIKLVSSPTLTFEYLTKLKILSLTSIKSFPKDICSSLETVPTDLEVLEIGDCEYLPHNFPKLIKGFTNLKSLRLENCCGKWDKFAKETFQSIRTLENLRILELINIEFSDGVEEELEKCDGITALLVIPAYVSQSATTNCHLIDCLKKLSTTLTHVVWGLTHELLRVTDLFITQYEQSKHNLGYTIDLSTPREPANNIPILKSRKPKTTVHQKNTSKTVEIDKSDNVDILSVPHLQTLLETIMINAKTKVIKIPFSSTTRVYLSEQFDDL